MNYTNAEITDRRDHDQPDANEVQVWRAYASGNHRDVLSVDQKRLLAQRSTHPMTDNILNLILTTTASRLKLTSWDVLGEPPTSVADGSALPEGEIEAVKGWLANVWLTNRLPRLQYEVHYAQLRDGQSVVSMGYRNGRVHLWREPWWDGESGVFIAYDDGGDYAFAVKEWDQRDRSGTITRRRTIYEPGEMTRWEQDGKGWKAYQRENEPAVVPMIRTGGEPMSIPMVHFPNGATITDGSYGQSDVPAMLALQDDLNATQLDVSAAALMTAFQRLFVSGMDDPKKLALKPGSVFGISNTDARLQVVQSGDLSQLMAAHHFKRESMSISSRTPVHTLTGDWPSGAALLRAEMPLIDKVEALGDVDGPQWTMVQHRAMEQANAFGIMSLNENVPVTSVFAPAERIDELTELEIKQARADVWEVLSRLPREAMIQAGVDATTAGKIVDQRETNRLQVERALNAGMIDPAFEDEEE